MRHLALMLAFVHLGWCVVGWPLLGHGEPLLVTVPSCLGLAFSYRWQAAHAPMRRGLRPSRPLPLQGVYGYAALGSLLLFFVGPILLAILWRPTPGVEDWTPLVVVVLG